MAEEIGRWFLTMESRVMFWDRPCEIYGGQTGSGTGFALSNLIFPC